MCGLMCDDFCAQKSSCGECTNAEGGKCGWCESDKTFGCMPIADAGYVHFFCIWHTTLEFLLVGNACIC